MSPIGMVSIRVRSKPRPWAKRIRSSNSSSLTPFSATALSLTSRPAFSAASMPAMTWAKSPQRVMALKRSGFERVERDVDALDAGVLQLLGELGELAAVGGERELVEAAGVEVAREGAEQPQDVLAHQRLAAGDAQLAHALGDERRAQTVELLQREQVLLGQEGHVLRHAIGAAEIAAIGDGHAQIGHVPAEGVDHGVGTRCQWQEHVHVLGS